MAVYVTFYQSPLGTLEIEGNEHFISAVRFREQSDPSLAPTPISEPAASLPPYVHTCVQQLDEYFTGKRQVFSLRLSQPGTPFQQKVWESLLSIPFGQTASYLRIAQMLDNPEAVRAIGSANGRNQLAIIVPCHRIIGHDGKLTGYAGGLWRKHWLLEHERKHTGNGQLSLFS